MALSSWTFFIQPVSAIFAPGVKEPESRGKVWQSVNELSPLTNTAVLSTIDLVDQDYSEA